MSTHSRSRGNGLAPANRGVRNAMQAANWCGPNVDQPSRLLECWIVISANLGWICLLAVVGGALGWAVAALQPSMYQARTLLEIRSLKESPVDTEAGSIVNPTGGVLTQSHIQTEIKILTSDSLRKEALQNLAGMRPAAGREELSSSYLQSWLSKVDRSSVPYSALVADGGPKIKVRAVSNTSMVEIVCDARDALLAAKVCNALANVYMRYKLASRTEVTKETAAWLNSRLEEVRKRLEKAENDQKSDSGRVTAPELDADEDLAQEKLREIQAQLSHVQNVRVQRQEAYEAALTRPANVLPLDSDSGSIRELRPHLQDLERQMAEFSATLTPEQTEVRQVQHEIEEMRRQLETEHFDVISRLKASVDEAQNEEAKLQEAYNSQSAEVAQQRSKSAHHNMIAPDVDPERRLDESLLRKVDELGLQTAMRMSNISVVDPAVPPLAPYSPRTFTSIATGILLCSCIGLSFSFIRLKVDRSLHGPGEAAFHLHLRELGVIPSVEYRPFCGLLSRSCPTPKPVMQSASEMVIDADTLGAESSSQGRVPVRSTAVAEAFFATTNSLLFAIGKANSRVIVMTSPDAGDGKTTVATNLAIALEQIGRRVVLVDGNMRKPRLAQVFDVDAEGGLADLLNETDSIEERSIAELVYASQLPNLFILPTAVASERTVAKLHSSRLQALLDRLKREFDVVIVDSPPMLNVSDARVLGSRADGVVLVFRARKTTIEDALAANDCLSQDGTRILGTILNDWNPRKTVKYAPSSVYFRTTA